MSTVLDTVTEYEEKALELTTRFQEPAVDYLKKAVDFVDSRLPEERYEWPEQVPTPLEVVNSQFAFAKKVLANQEKFAKNIAKALAPLTGETTTRKPKVAKAAA